MFGFFAKRQSTNTHPYPTFQDILNDAMIGNAEAPIRVAEIYCLGAGVKQNPVEAAAWYKRAAESGDVRAQFALGNLYAGEKEFHEDSSKAFTWWTRAAEQGLKEAQYNLAVAYCDGRGPARDFAACAKWCRRAADQGHSDAQLLLGHLYRGGQGLRHDDSEALKWTLRAADQGNAVAQHTLAAMVYDIFNDRDDCNDVYVEAYMWSSIAHKKLWGETQAAAPKVRSVIAKRLTPEQIAEAERRARDWRPMAAFQAGR